MLLSLKLLPLALLLALAMMGGSPGTIMSLGGGVFLEVLNA